MHGSAPALSLFSGEFIETGREHAYRASHAQSEIQQFRVAWLTALLFFCAYGVVDYWLGQRSVVLLGLRATIVLLGVATVALGTVSPAARRRDFLGFAGLLLVSLCYSLMLRERAEPANPVGALLLLVVGIYMFSPGRFWLVCANAWFCSGAAALGLAALPQTQPDAWLAYSYLLPANVLAALALARLNRARRRVFWQQQCLRRETVARRRAQRALSRQYRRSRALLYNTLPASIARRLQAHPGRILASNHACGTVMFADIVGFSALTRQLSPARLLAILNYLFCGFDEATDRHGLEKIKTIGDAYMAVAGVSRSARGQAPRAGALALEQLEICARAAQRFNSPLDLRIGIHCGPLIAGVIGRRRYAFDVWGETVNIASRLQVAAQPGRILISRPVRDACAEQFLFGSSHTLQLRGCGEIQASNLYSLLATAQPVLDSAGGGFRRQVCP
ncbi:MAG: adenylate/guanylate cyclase domain-containing protein [Gammaproteobacteria bacterium]|nr:adenylate/guanylate cyclase domain-containing protein [Gammaproteobacteria bacterium]